ncbi:hypothetical protein FF36_01887 [Frankia torreyi]|uniref:Uncharacterized protein n=1 Tax=Frankia torreyi TaxID=1856 RepID=A0A0D8BJY5_9ACTN|nr:MULTISPECIES: hypothetical protein [Frankia]KJE23702.1 hypothetical protein FF36_01887 [Frankia torreyi]KQM05686.1 hypothetical protein FF86_1014104 [Frankia sp. CpI1-P]
MATLPGHSPKAVPAVVNGSGDFGPRRGSGLSIAQLAGRARAEHADPLRAQVMADPKIRNPEGFLIWLGRRKGGLNSHKGRSRHPGVGTRRLAGHDPSSVHAAPRAHRGGGDAPTMRLSRTDIGRALHGAAPTLVLPRETSRSAPKTLRPLSPPRPAVQDAPTVALRRPPAREADTVALKLPMSQAARATRAKPGGQWNALAVIPRTPEPEPVKLPPELAKLRVGNVKIHKKTKISKAWRLGRR